MSEDIRHITDAMSPSAKILTDLSSLGILVGTLIEVLPAIAAFLTIVWTALRIYDDHKVQRFITWIKNEKKSKTRR